MMTYQVAPGLVLDDRMFTAAEAGVAAHLPGLAPLTWERFTRPADWTLVPDDRGAGYKAEHQLFSTPERTAKINIWFAPDLRGGDDAAPHSHPWHHFAAYVLLGGYSEDRYTPDGDSVRAERGVEHVAGGINRIGREVYHEVTEIHAPGATLSLMICGRREHGRWGYLDLATGRHQPTEPDPDFGKRLRALNPQHR